VVRGCRGFRSRRKELLHRKTPISEILRYRSVWAPVHSWRSHQEKSKGGVRDPLAFSGFRGLKRQEDSHLGLRSRETRSTLSGEGCGHISDHEGESWCLVLVCIGVTHKDLWMHTSVC
jgi:hypothetical protein